MKLWLFVGAMLVILILYIRGGPYEMHPQPRHTSVIPKELKSPPQTTTTASSRSTFAQTWEERFLSRGMDVEITASGKNKDRLTVKYVLISRATVYQIANQTDFLDQCKREGFKRVLLTDGFHRTWTYDTVRGKFI